VCSENLLRAWRSLQRKWNDGKRVRGNIDERKQKGARVLTDRTGRGRTQKNENWEESFVGPTLKNGKKDVCLERGVREEGTSQNDRVQHGKKSWGQSQEKIWVRGNGGDKRGGNGSTGRDGKNERARVSEQNNTKSGVPSRTRHGNGFSSPPWFSPTSRGRS